MATGAHVEIESKFDVAASIAAPDLTLGGELAAAPTRTFQLSATYYDTADLRLMRAKITLRRRTGGTDAGWHVKLPAVTTGAETQERVEIGFALTDSTEVPDEVRATVLGQVRDAPLHPIARIDNERHVTVLSRRGAPVAEFCDDHVTATTFRADAAPEPQPQQWREWEVEWVGDPDAVDYALLAELSAACLAAGASAAAGPSKLTRAVGPLPPSDRPSGHVVGVLTKDIDQLLAHDPGARRATMVGIHQTRVATRNLRSSLGTYGEELSAAAAEHDRDLDVAGLAGELKLLAAVLGKVRDVQVVRERLHRLAELYSPDIVPAHVRRRIDTELDSAEARAGQRVGQALSSPRYLAVLEALDRLLEVAALVDTSHGLSPHHPHHPAPLGPHADSTTAGDAASSPVPAAQSPAAARRLALAGVNRQFKKFSKVRSRTEEDLASLELTLAQREELTHVVRKRAKALRRSVQAIDRDEVPAVAPLRSACSRLHTVLGEVQDSVTTRQWLRRIARRAEAEGESTFGFGVLFEHERGFSERTLEGFESEAATVTAAFRELQAAEKSARKKRKKHTKKR